MRGRSPAVQDAVPAVPSASFFVPLRASLWLFHDFCKRLSSQLSRLQDCPATDESIGPALEPVAAQAPKALPILRLWMIISRAIPATFAAFVMSLTGMPIVLWPGMSPIRNATVRS